MRSMLQSLTKCSQLKSNYSAVRIIVKLLPEKDWRLTMDDAKYVFRTTCSVPQDSVLGLLLDKLSKYCPGHTALSRMDWPKPEELNHEMT